MKRMSQVDMVLRHINDHGSITSMEAFGEYGITRLSDVILKIRRKCGMTIITDTRESVNRYGVKVIYGVYRKANIMPYESTVKVV